MKPDIMQLGPQSRAWAVRLAFAVALVGRWRQRGAASFVICEKGRVHPLRGPEVPAGAVSIRQLGDVVLCVASSLESGHGYERRVA